MYAFDRLGYHTAQYNGFAVIDHHLRFNFREFKPRDRKVYALDRGTDTLIAGIGIDNVRVDFRTDTSGDFHIDCFVVIAYCR